MSYRNCDQCGGSNKASSRKCYNCDASLSDEPVKELESVDPHENIGWSKLPSYSMVLGIALTTAFGGILGMGLSFLSFELPFFLEELGLGALCALGAAYSLGKMLEMPDGLLGPRLLPATLFGACVGLCLFGVWWSFDPSAGFPVIGMIAGFCSSIPICVSFGLTGGESRPIGRLEFINVGVSLALGILMAFLFAVEEFDLDFVPGIARILGLIPTLLGARINLIDIAHMFDSGSEGSHGW